MHTHTNFTGGTAPSTSAEAPGNGDCGSIPHRGGDESPLPFALPGIEEKGDHAGLFPELDIAAAGDTASPVPLPVVKRSAKSKLSHLSDEQRAQLRREQNKEAKQRQRSKGDVKIEIILTPMEWAEICAMREKQRGPLAGFFRRALITGAKFIANTGTPKGGKVKGNSRTAGGQAPMMTCQQSH